MIRLPFTMGLDVLRVDDGVAEDLLRHCVPEGDASLRRFGDHDPGRCMLDDGGEARPLHLELLDKPTRLFLRALLLGDVAHLDDGADRSITLPNRARGEGDGIE